MAEREFARSSHPLESRGVRNCHQFFLNHEPCALAHARAALGQGNRIDSKTQLTEFLNQALVVDIPAGASIEIAWVDEIEFRIGLEGVRITGTVTFSSSWPCAMC